MARPKIVRKAGGKSGPSFVVKPGTEAPMEAIAADTIGYQELFQARMAAIQVELDSASYVSNRLKNMMREYYQQALKTEHSTYRLMLQQQERKLAAAYGKLVGAGLTASNINTLKQLHRLQSASFAAVMGQFEEAVQKTFLRLNDQVQRDLLYRQAVEKLGEQGFKLYITTSDNPEAREVIEHLIGLSESVRRICQPLVYNALWTAFNKAWSGLTEEQFPKRYKALVRYVIFKKLKPRNAIVIHGSGPQSWTLSISFTQLFGDHQDLERGSHFGALLATGAGPKNLLEDLFYENDMAKERRVKLPFKGGEKALKNPWHVRYKFWKALWSGQDYYPELHSGSENEDTARSELTKRHTKRLAEIDSNINIINNKKFGKRYRPSQLFDDRAYKPDKTYIQRQRHLKKLQREKVELTNKIDSGQAGTPVIPTSGLREKTIQARTAFWQSIGKAPFWWFLEFGQFRYPPIIPPRGLTFIFKGVMEQVVTEATNRTYHKIVQKYTTDTKGGAAGRHRLAAGANVEQIVFQNINPRTRPGGFLPKTLIAKEKQVLTGIELLRNAAQAEAAAGVFAVGDTGGRYTPDTLDTYVSDAIFRKSLGPGGFGAYRPVYDRRGGGRKSKFEYPAYHEWAHGIRSSAGASATSMPDSPAMISAYQAEKAKALATWEEVQIQNEIIKMLKAADELE